MYVFKARDCSLVAVPRGRSLGGAGSAGRSEGVAAARQNKLQRPTRVPANHDAASMNWGDPDWFSCIFVSFVSHCISFSRREESESLDGFSLEPSGGGASPDPMQVAIRNPRRQDTRPVEIRGYGLISPAVHASRVRLLRLPTREARDGLECLLGFFQHVKGGDVSVYSRLDEGEKDRAYKVPFHAKRIFRLRQWSGLVQQSIHSSVKGYPRSSPPLPARHDIPSDHAWVNSHRVPCGIPSGILLDTLSGHEVAWKRGW